MLLLFFIVGLVILVVYDPLGFAVVRTIWFWIVKIEIVHLLIFARLVVHRWNWVVSSLAFEFRGRGGSLPMGLLLPLRFLMYFRAASLDRIRLRCRRQAVYAYSSQAMRMCLIADARARGFGMQNCKNEIAAVVRMPVNVAIVKAFCVRRCFHMRKAGTGRGPCRGSGG